MVIRFSSLYVWFCLSLVLIPVASSQSILDFDYDADGPWNDETLTNVTVPEDAKWIYRVGWYTLISGIWWI